MNELDKIAKAMGIGNLIIEITDEKIILTPAESGKRLLGKLEFYEEQNRILDDITSSSENTIKVLRQEDHEMRLLLEKVYEVLMKENYYDLATSVHKKTYWGDPNWVFSGDEAPDSE